MGFRNMQEKLEKVYFKAIKRQNKFDLVTYS